VGLMWVSVVQRGSLADINCRSGSPHLLSDLNDLPHRIKLHNLYHAYDEWPEPNLKHL